MRCCFLSLPCGRQGFGSDLSVAQKSCQMSDPSDALLQSERWGAGVETQINVRGEIGGWGRVPFNETYAPSLSTIYDGA